MKSYLFLLAVLGVWGCSSADEESDPNGSVSKFCANWGEAACNTTVIEACSGADKVSDALKAACVDEQRAFCEGLLPSTGFSSRHASECLDAVRDAYADGKLTATEIATVRHRGAPCNHLIKGPQQAGETCSSDDDCNTLDDYSCVVKSGEGTCQIPTLVPNGTSCAEPEAACNPGFYCDGDNCIASKAVGGKCTADFECKSGLSCDSDTQKCTARVSQTNCTADSDCTTNVCSVPVGSSTGLCVSSIILAPSESSCEDLR